MNTMWPSCKVLNNEAVGLLILNTISVWCMNTMWPSCKVFNNEAVGLLILNTISVWCMKAVWPNLSSSSSLFSKKEQKRDIFGTLNSVQ